MNTATKHTMMEDSQEDMTSRFLPNDKIVLDLTNITVEQEHLVFFWVFHRLHHYTIRVPPHTFKPIHVRMVYNLQLNANAKVCQDVLKSTCLSIRTSSQ